MFYEKIRFDWRRSLPITFILLFFMLNAGLFKGSYLLVAIRCLTFLVYTGFWLPPHEWWNLKRILMATIAVSILVVMSLLLQNNLISIYMMIILTFPASYCLKDRAYFYYLFIILLEIFSLLTLFGHHNYSQSLSILLFFIGISVSIRARVTRQEANKLSQLHLKELEKAHKELQQAAVTTMQHAVLDERTRIAREIHDAIGHSLTSLIVQLQALRFMIEDDPDQAKQSVEEMLTVARQGLQDIRVSVHSLAADRSALGIAPLQALVSKTNATSKLECTFRANSQAEDLPSEAGAVLFKVLQEAMTNILRHSQATRVEVDVSVSGRDCSMTIKDNGNFSVNRCAWQGYGIKSMRERVQEVGGSIMFNPVQPSGLNIITHIPIPPQDL
ncbi:sensor histidine kinase [Desulfosporosinus sp. FKA]|uniref:sensor histidine kinase n=1 Tax=Desulfosporosinus sp. FKA TaxID=1969834 RepID=UPI000B49FB29|nr:sensor histidine kinase [Desulfosporosinus sp. FKA]